MLIALAITAQAIFAHITEFHYKNNWRRHDVSRPIKLTKINNLRLGNRAIDGSDFQAQRRHPTDGEPISIIQAFGPRGRRGAGRRDGDPSDSTGHPARQPGPGDAVAGFCRS